MRLRSAALGVAACACSATGAVAQSAGGQGRQIHGSASVSGTYDSRFTGASKELAIDRNIDAGEYILRPQLSLSVSQPIGRQMLSLKGSVGYEFHKNNPRFDQPRANLQADYSASLGRCQAVLASNYRVTQNELDRLDEPGIKNLQQGYSFSAGGTCATATGLIGGATVQHSAVRNSARLQKESDSNTDTVSTQLGYGNPTIGRVSVVYTYSDSELPNRVILGGPRGDGFAAHSLGLSISRDIGSRLVMQAALGRTTVVRDFTPPGVDRKVTSTTYSAAGTYKLGSRLTLNGAAKRGVSPTGRAGKLYDINTGLEGSASYQLGTRFSLSAGRSLSKVKSNIDTSIPVAVISSARTTSTFGSIRFRQSDHASMSLNVRYDDRKTDLPQFNYTATRVSLSAEVGF